MIKSKFSFFSYFIYLQIIVFSILIVYLYLNRINAFGEYHNRKFIFVSSILVFIILLSIFGIIKKRASIITISDKTIEVYNIFHLKKYSFEEFEGYSKSTEVTKVGLKFEILTLFSKDSERIIIAESMYRNYTELKTSITKYIKNIN